MKGYLNKHSEAPEALRNGWFHTGDVATVDEEDFIVIADRMSDVIRSGSEMVQTVLLENLAAMAAFVLEATVAGVQDEVWGEKAMAIIKLVAGSTKTEEDLIEFLKREGVDKGRITKWKLSKLVAIVDHVPKTRFGKYNKRDQEESRHLSGQGQGSLVP